MKKMNSGVFACLVAGMFSVSAAENFYSNAEYKSSLIKGVPSFHNHWSRGKVSPVADSGKKAAVRLEIEPKGNVLADGIFCTAKGVDLKPGSYCLSVDCRTETDLDSVYLYVSWQTAPGKRTSSGRTFPAALLTKGKWTRLTCSFEVKAGCDKYAFGYGIRSKTAAAALFADPRVAAVGIYKNPFYQTRQLPNGGLILENHWYKGKLTVEGDYQGQPAVKVESDKANWGEGIFAGTVSTEVIPELKPGKYLLTVRCRPAEGAQYNAFNLFFTRKLKGETRRTMIRKNYGGTNLPEAGKWTELVMPVEVKDGDSNFSFAYGFWGKEVSSASFADPKIIPDETEEE